MADANPTPATPSNVERWRPVLGFEGIYEVSDRGRVKRIVPVLNGPAGYILRPGPSSHPGGYVLVGLRRDGKPTTHTVHKLVLQAFVGPRPPGMECRHMDGNPTNNALSNLRWGTRKENMRDQLRHGTQYLAKRTHCDNGHEFTPENTIIRTDTPRSWRARRCRTCLKQNNRRRYLENREERLAYQKRLYWKKKEKAS